jgi:hypothetical protein
MDSLAAHPDELAGFSQLLWNLSLLSRMCSLDSLVAHADALAGFPACLPLSLDALVAHVSRMRWKFIFFDVDSHILIEYCRRTLLSCGFVF